MAAGKRDQDTLLVLYAPWCPFCQVGGGAAQAGLLNLRGVPPRGGGAALGRPCHALPGRLCSPPAQVGAFHTRGRHPPSRPNNH